MKQKKYIEALLRMRFAMMEAVMEASRMDEDESLLIADAYPFSKSFDEVLTDVENWIDQQRKLFSE